MRDVFIYDHVRTPRGRGRPDGSLHEIHAIQLVTQLLEAVRDRNSLDTALLDDVVIGCAQPVGEQGGVLARAAVLNAGYADTVGGQQVHRFCGSWLEAVNNVAGQGASGMAMAGIGGGVESMSRTIMGYDSGAWAADPRVALHNYYTPQGIGADLIANAGRVQPHRRRQLCRRKPAPRWRGLGRGALCPLDRAGARCAGRGHSRQR